MRKPDYTRRVAVTGLGIVSPVGSDIPTAWANLVAGNSGLREITYWDPSSTDCRAAGEVHDLDPNVWMDFKAVRRTDRTWCSRSPRPSRRRPTRVSDRRLQRRRRSGWCSGRGRRTGFMATPSRP